MHPVELHLRQSRCQYRFDCHTTSIGFAAQKAHHVAYDVVDVEERRLPFALFDQRTHADDDFARAQPRAADVDQGGMQLVVCRRTASEQRFGGLGIGDDRAQRLVDLVRDRRRQFAGQGQARGLFEFRAMTAGRRLRLASAAPLEDQQHDERRLAEDQERRAEDLRPVVAPQRSFPKENFASRRQARLVDAESGENPCVGHAPGLRRRKHAGSRARIGGKSLQHQIAQSPATQRQVVDLAAYGAVAHVGFESRIDRNTCAARDVLQDLRRHEDLPARIPAEHEEHTGVARSQRCHALPQSVERQSIPILDGQTLAQGCELVCGHAAHR